ncbi:hypothetical protein F443_22331 [Phytophthora nicotianae P1569]|uniref:Uncharacterized protein n=1 Tax=Phytophthora nicotianae P1569 TaxID=1317065 RepID=V9DX09_PHYNI|nr:hypothetical protein F443_22331 [Phytophthora nicotianae P1569]
MFKPSLILSFAIVVVLALTSVDAATDAELECDLQCDGRKVCVFGTDGSIEAARAYKDVEWLSIVKASQRGIGGKHHDEREQGAQGTQERIGGLGSSLRS